MARSISTAVAITFFLFLATLVSNSEGRKLLMSSNDTNRNVIKVPSLISSLIFSALPRGTVPSSSPSKKGHATLQNEKLFQRHLATIDRILQSVPSPGVGH